MCPRYEMNCAKKFQNIKLFLIIVLFICVIIHSTCLTRSLNFNTLNFYYSFYLQASGKIKDFLVLSKLASGQFGRVYLAEDTVDKKKYAIKTISRDVILRKNMQTEVEAEKDYLYATNSPFIVSLIQHFEVSI